MSIGTNKLRSEYDVNRRTLADVERFMADMAETYRAEEFHDVLEKHRGMLNNYMARMDKAAFEARSGQ